jgi:hypothetical protein
MKFLCVLPVSAFLVSLVACGPSSGESSGGTLSEVAAAAAAHCAPPGDTSSALSLALLQQLPGVYLDATELSLCAQAMNAGNCKSVHCVLAISEWGTLPTGAACTSDVQCLSSSCTHAEGATCGTCKADSTCATPCTGGQVCNNGTCIARPKAAAVGGICVDAPCDDGLTCVKGRCVASPKVGESCDGNSTRACVPGAQCTASKCVALPGEGAACFSNDECSPTLVCGSSGSCRKAVTVPLGAPCDFGDVCTGGICDSDPASSTGAGKCRVADKVGMPCTGQTCDAGSICSDVSNTCVTLASLVCR